MGGLILIVVGIVWWWRFVQPPANYVLQIILGVYLAYAWYSAGAGRGWRSPWELAAALILLEDSYEEYRGIEAAGQNVIGFPQALVALTGLIYLLDRRAPGGPRRVLTGAILLVGGVVWNVFTASRWQSGQADTSLSWLLALAGLVALYLWWSHRQEDHTSAWQFGIGLALVVAGLAVYAGFYGRLVPLLLIGTGIGEFVATRATKQMATG